MPADTSDTRWALHQLVNALRLAALPAQEQVAALPDFVQVADEIALEYDQAFQRVPQLVEAGVLTAEQAEPLATLDQLFAAMTDATDKDTVWTLPAMEGDERWAQTRTIALAALAAVGASLGHPDFDVTTWVEGS